MAERAGWLLLDGWAGRTAAIVTVVGATPKRYRIRTGGGGRVKLGGRARWLVAGQTALVPRHAISFKAQPPEGFTRV